MSQRRISQAFTPMDVWRAAAWLLLAACALPASFAVAYQTPSRASSNERPRFDAVVRIVNREGDGASLGSGTRINGPGDASLILTCAHLFADGVGAVYIVGPQGDPQPAVLVGIDESNDIACLLTTRHTTAVARLAAQLPEFGAELISCGFGEDGTLALNRGKHVGYVTLEGGQPQGVLELSGRARQGDSGGPIFNARGEIVGVIMGTDGTTVDGTHCRRIRQFLAQHTASAAAKTELARLAARPIDREAFLWEASVDTARLTSLETPALSTLKGRVLFGGRPVADAKVRLRGASPQTARVDSQGRFTFPDLIAGAYRIEVETVIKNRIREANRPVYVSAGGSPILFDVDLE